MTYEEQVRKLDNIWKTVPELAREISPKLGLSVRVCGGYLYAKRAGYSSMAEYRGGLAIAKGFDSEMEMKSFKKAQKKYGEKYTLEQFRATPKQSFDWNALAKYFRTCSVPQTCMDYHVSEQEKRVISLDNPKTTMANSAKNAAEKTGIVYGTCFRYISNLRKGITDGIYVDFLARQSGFVSAYEKTAFDIENKKNKKLTIEQFRKEAANQEGFDSPEAYVRFLEDRRLYFTKQENKKTRPAQKHFEYSAVDFHNPAEVDEMTPAVDQPFLDNFDKEEFWKLLESMLKPREYKILYAEFADERTTEDMTGEFNICCARIHQIRAKTFRKLRHPSRLRILEEFF